jgi:hypothetical protein
MPTIFWVWLSIILTPLAILLAWMGAVLLWSLMARCGEWLWGVMRRDRTRLNRG